MHAVSAIERYRDPNTPLPTPNLAWNTYGVGVSSIGLDGRPEPLQVGRPGPDQLLIRVDAVGLCFSDVKLIKLGGDHPKLYGRDLSVEPTRLGHEATVTVIEVGEALAHTYQPGQRLAIQPDIYVGGRSTAYGYTIPGGLVQYHLIGPEVLAADDGAYVIPVEDSIGYAAAALSEPWACVEASYTQRRRLEPLAGGTMWIIGSPGDDVAYSFTSGLDQPAHIVLTDVSDATKALVEASRGRGAQVMVRDGIGSLDLQALVHQVTGGAGFDDIVMLAPTSGSAVSAVARHIGFRGTLNLVGTTPLDSDPDIDVGRIHYHYTAYVGNTGPDIAASYGVARNRCELREGGVAVFVGAGGPMGQMHIQRAIELDTGPSVLIAADLDDARLEVVRERLVPMAERAGRRVVVINSSEDPGLVERVVAAETGGVGADDVIVSVPAPSVMGDAARLMGPDGMLVLFAGVANGSFAPLALSDVYLHNAQFTGTSGSHISDQAVVLEKALAGTLSPQRSLAAVGGIDAAQDGVQAMLDGRFAGKIMIFPQLRGLPLTGLEELAEREPAIGALMDEGATWTIAAEEALIETFWPG